MTRILAWWLFHGDSYNDWYREEVDRVIFLFHIWNDGFWRADHDLPSFSGRNSGLWMSCEDGERGHEARRWVVA